MNYGAWGAGRKPFCFFVVALLAFFALRKPAAEEQIDKGEEPKPLPKATRAEADKAKTRDAAKAPAETKKESARPAAKAEVRGKEPESRAEEEV